MNPDSERRKQPRIRKEVPAKISATDADFITQTENLSASGAFFLVEKAIPLMTRLAVTLLVPTQGRKRMTRKITCDGVVVRCDPVDAKKPEGPHNIALYFTSLKDTDKKSLAKFVQQVLGQ